MKAREHFRAWCESEPERLEKAANRWDAAPPTAAARIGFWNEMAAEARKAAANLRAMRAARLRYVSGG